MAEHNPVTICGLDSRGNPESVSSISNGLSIKHTEYHIGVINGEYPTDTFVGKFYFRDTNAANTDTMMWSDNTNLTILTSAETLTVAYNNTTDGLGTTGALSLLIDYLDENNELQSTIHTLSNTGSDVISVNNLGVNRAVVISSGTADTNTNDITITATTSATTQAHIPAGYGVTQQSVFNCPISVTPVIDALKITASRIGSGTEPTVTIFLRVYNRLTDTNYIVRKYILDTNVTTSIVDMKPIPLSGRDVVYITYQSTRDNTTVTGGYDLIYRSTA
jgi:hypothetical protein